ncbi:MAG: hypothetical protein AAGD34_01195 [Pseudomonadota bacterium]
MGLFAFGDLQADEVVTLAELADSAYANEDAPAGWTTLLADDLGFEGSTTRGSFQGNYYETGLSSAFLGYARVLQNGDSLTISFRGTDSVADYILYPEIINFDSFVKNFAPLLESVSDYISANGIADVFVTGHSLGAAAVNELQNLAASNTVEITDDTSVDYGDFADATYVAFASPEIFKDADVLNIGFEDDWVFKAVERETPLSSAQPDFASATNNVVWFDETYASSDFAFPLFNPYSDTTAHHVENYISAAMRIPQSIYYDQMDRNSVVILVDVDSEVTDKKAPTSDHFGDPAFYIGRDVADIISGGTAGDFISGFAGDDTLAGNEGNDKIDGGDGLDQAIYNSVSTDYTITDNGKGLYIISQTGGDKLDGTDKVRNVEQAVFTDMTIDLSSDTGGPAGEAPTEPEPNTGPSVIERFDPALQLLQEPGRLLIGTPEPDRLQGGSGDDEARGKGGDDTINGRKGDDGLFGDANDDLILGGNGSDLLVGGTGNDVLKGENGRDFLNGEGGNDLLEGGDGRDALFGDGGNDSLFGGDGNDYLKGDSGRNELTGGEGDDDFVISSRGKTDIVLDFVSGEDTIVFQGDFLFGQYSDLSFRNDDEGLKIYYDGTLAVLLAGLTEADVAKTDFEFL